MLDPSEIIQIFQEYEFLIDSELIEYLIKNDYPLERLEYILTQLAKTDLTYINKDLFVLIDRYVSILTNLNINWAEFEKSIALFQKNPGHKIYHHFLNYFEDIVNKKNIADDSKESEYFKSSKEELYFSNSSDQKTNNSKELVDRSYSMKQNKNKDLRDNNENNLILKSVTTRSRVKLINAKIQKNKQTKKRKITPSTSQTLLDFFKNKYCIKDNLETNLDNINTQKILENSNNNLLKDKEKSLIKKDSKKESFKNNSVIINESQYLENSNESEELINENSIKNSNVEISNFRDNLSHGFKDIIDSKYGGNVNFDNKNVSISNNLNTQDSKNNFDYKKQDTITIFKNILRSALPFSYDYYINSKIEDMGLEVLFSYYDRVSAKSVEDFVGIFRARLNFLKNLLQKKPQLRSVLPIRRIFQFKHTNNISIIGMIKNIERISSDRYLITLEDESGEINAIIPGNSNAIKKADSLVLDEVIGVVGSLVKDKLFIDEIIFPDILPKRDTFNFEDFRIVFISDIHVGSKQFLEKEFNMFIDWLNLKSNNPRLNELAKKVKYIFILGDLVDGVGIYPSQYEELNIFDIFEQYEKLSYFIKKIPEHIKIIIIPGNHDAVRLSEPQPVIPYFLAKFLWDQKNVLMLSNPSMVRLKDLNNSDFDILLYHGYSFDYFVANVSYIRNSGGYDNTANLMKFLLIKRHLAPTYGSTLYYATKDDDFLLIKKTPDVFVSGHVHKLSVDYYKGVRLICSSCWQSRTSFQEKVGHHPEPGRVAVLNPNNKNVEVLNFLS